MRSFSGLLLAGLIAFSTSVQASPDVDFPQPGYSYGGKVRSGPGMNFRQVGSLHEGDQILILTGTGAMMNGYEWFEIRYRNGRTGYQWGGIMCSQNPYPTIFRVCDGPRLQSNAPVQANPPVTSQPQASAGINGFTVGAVIHPGGSFNAVGNGQWQETDAQGRVSFHFQEETRDEWSVYLFDASRNVSLQLDLHRGQVLYGVGAEPKRVLYQITGSFAQAGTAQTGGVLPQPPSSTTVRYTCAEGLPLTVTYVNSGNGHAIFSIDGSPEERLEQVPSGSGSQYTNGRFTLFSKGNSATLQHPSGVDNCFE
ncbi:MliC family protein [Roseibium sediminicola]|uniref:MliC family protein n=1 Tax=Roseibium sediminicola TaxID=2933272 RepID=A0ABT0H2K0_9HYPH|nr:MliC family protein [Roseibium sp. CAU 1639]MCK7615522.1 MliC family protein [Roseibium sp. CAU 1639]